MGEGRLPDERPIHWVQLSPFWLGETPVTNQQYDVYLAQRAASGKPVEEPRYWRDRRFALPEQPVVGVSWHQAMDFCRWLSEVSGLVVQLPTEAQWEYAARGPDERTYPWGHDVPDASRACFGLDPGKGQPSPVGSFPTGKGPFGTLDQAGSVFEWCLDVWDDEAYQKRVAEGEVVDPVRTGEPDAESDLRVLRGGGWGGPSLNLRSACRFWNWAGLQFDDVGFRVAVIPARSRTSSFLVSS
jgi:formylglycine-generating enzyme required for sulfatase activity